MSTENIEPIIYNGVATMGGKYLVPKEIGTVIWSLTDYEEQLHTKKLNDIIYFTVSSVNILSATVFSESTKYYEVTWVATKGEYSIFTWYFGLYKKKSHSE